MRSATLWLVALVLGVLLIGSGSSVHGQGAFAHGAVVALQGTPHLWIADAQGVLHWGGDTRALAGKHVNWNDRRDVSLAELQTFPIGDPWLSAGLLKDGDPIYQVKWETEWLLPKLLHIQRIEDVEIFGIWTANYGNYVNDKAAWEQRYGIDAASLERQPLASAVPPGVTLTINRAPSTPAPPPAPAPAPAAPVAVAPIEAGEWIYNTREDELTGAVEDNTALFSDDYGMLLMLRCNTNTIMEGFVGVTEEREPLPGGPEKRIRAYYRFGDGAIVDGWWGSSVKQDAAFIPIEDLASFIEGLADSTKLVVRLVNHKGVEYTGVFNTTGAPGQVTKLFRRCTA